jgi:hypothetical protein
MCYVKRQIEALHIDNIKGGRVKEQMYVGGRESHGVIWPKDLGGPRPALRAGSASVHISLWT